MKQVFDLAESKLMYSKMFQFDKNYPYSMTLVIHVEKGKEQKSFMTTIKNTASACMVCSRFIKKG